MRRHGREGHDGEEGRGAHRRARGGSRISSTRRSRARSSGGSSSRTCARSSTTSTRTSRSCRSSPPALPKISGDGKTVTIKLRDGIKFNDGTKFDAAAVKTSLDRHRSLKESGRASRARAGQLGQGGRPEHGRDQARDAVRAADRAARRPRGHGHVAQAAQEARRQVRAPTRCASGRSSTRAAVEGDSIVLERAPDYYDASKVKLDKLTFKIIIESSARASNLRSGDVDVDRPARADRSADDQEGPEAADAGGDLARVPGTHASTSATRTGSASRPGRSTRRSRRSRSCARRSTPRSTARASRRSSTPTASSRHAARSRRSTRCTTRASSARAATSPRPRSSCRRAAPRRRCR